LVERNDASGAGSVGTTTLLNSIQRIGQNGGSASGPVKLQRTPQAIDSLLLESIRRIGRAGIRHN
jgi:hypothetical protein